MARNRQLYEDVMDVALRATLKEFGFKRKTYATYIMERPERRWIFELESEPWLGAGFKMIAAVHVPALDAIFEKYIPGFRVHCVVTRTRPSAHVDATIPQLMEIAEGHDFYTVGAGFTSKVRPKGYETAKHPEIMDFRQNMWWVLPHIPMMTDLDINEEEYERIIWKNIEKLGRFLDEQWRTHVPAWYERCNDPPFVADWIEHHDTSAANRVDLTYAVLHHLGGNDERAAQFLWRRVKAAEITYDELYSEYYRERRGSWLRRLLYPGGWSEERVAEQTASSLEYWRELSEAARKLADGLGIAL